MFYANQRIVRSIQSMTVMRIYFNIVVKSLVLKVNVERDWYCIKGFTNNLFPSFRFKNTKFTMVIT
jgi:hypothetical protein